MDMKISSWLDYLEEMYGDRKAVTCYSSLSFYELLNSSRRCAMTLHSAGVKKGERVALWAANDLDWIVSFFGIIMSGGVAVLMDYGLNSEDTAARLRLVDADWTIIGNNKVSAISSKAAVEAAMRGGVSREHILNIDMLYKVAMDNTQPFDWTAFYEVDSFINPRDSQVVIFSSGTTEVPKAVQLSSYALLSNAEAVTDLLKNDITYSICDALPLFQSFGLMVLLSWLQSGNQVYIVPSLKPQPVMDMISQNKIMGIASTGSIYSGLLRLQDYEEKICGRVRTCLVVDGFTTPTEMMRFENSLKGGKFLIGYGLTECSPTISFCTGADPLECRATSVGRILPGVDVKIWREDVGFLMPGEIGEILVKGPNIMNGYLGVTPDKQPFDPEGWLHTGDLGMFDEFGLLKLTGRIKDIIIRNGEKISPMEIEEVIMENQEIREVKVFGAPHPIWGESIEACFVPEHEDYDPEELRKFLWKRLSFNKIPSHLIKYSSFPENFNGKLDLKILKADLLDKIRKITISEALDDGMKIVTLNTGNRTFTITPICDMVQGITELLEFKRKQMNRIRLAVEEMLTERIRNAYEDVGEITIDVILMPEWLRIRFTDSGKTYRLDDDDASLSAKIILANVDAYSSVVNNSKLSGINLDWQYKEGFKVDEFLEML